MVISSEVLKKAEQFEILDEDKRIISGWASVEVVDIHLSIPFRIHENNCGGKQRR